MPDSKIIGPYGYSGGLNTDASLLTLPKGQLSTLQNMIVEQGQLKPVPGYSTASITQPPVVTNQFYMTLLAANLTVSSEYAGYLFLPWRNDVAMTGGCLYCKNFTGSWTSMGNGPYAAYGYVYSADVLNNVVTFVAFSGMLGASAASGIGIWQWDGTGDTTQPTVNPTNAPIAFKVVNNFAFVVDCKGIVAWSSVGDPTTWPANNSLTFRYGDGDMCVALGRIGNTLYIFKLHSIGALQTNTVIISGSVALGPLYTIYDKIGTFSMNSVDNLPTGELVFWGSDYNIYKFDGSNLTNLSKRSYPQSSIQENINSFISSNSGIGPNYLSLKVVPIFNSIILNIGGQTSGGVLTATKSWAYNYVSDYWYMPTPTFSSLCCLEAFGSASTWNPTSVTEVCVGMNMLSTSIYNVSNNYLSFNGTAISGQAVVSIPYTFESRDTIPRSVIIPFTINASDSITITPGDDGTYRSGTSPTPTGNLQRVIIPLNFSDSTMSKQIKITTSSSNDFSINPVVLDTEIGH